MAKKDRKRKLKQKLTDKYRLVILNEDTFQERFSLKLSRLNVFVLGGLFSILLIALTTLLIAFTSLREYIPGYSSTSLKRKASRLTYQTDSLKNRLTVLETYTKALKPVLTGEIKPEKIDSIVSLNNQTLAFDEKSLQATKRDSLFREQVDSKDRYPLANITASRAKNVFFSPLTGVISQAYNLKEKHPAVDIVAKAGTPVKAIANGTVILAEWTAETGYVIMIQHSNQFLSVYKHNGILLKQQGDFIKSGEVIANVGSTGELSTGPHLHFELWSDGYSVNPTNYIAF
ncbi:MAG: M23 family metallopeptidase [Tenacibaculum sp.]